MLFQRFHPTQAPAPLVTPHDEAAAETGKAVLEASGRSGTQALRAVAASHNLDTANARVQRILGDLLTEAANSRGASDS